MLELVGFVFRFEDFLALCCDCVQHNVLCNESEFSTVCVIQTVGSPVTRQGLNCFFVSAFLNFFWPFVTLFLTTVSIIYVPASAIRSIGQQIVRQLPDEGGIGYMNLTNQKHFPSNLIMQLVD